MKKTMCETCRKKEVCKDFSDLEFDVRLCEDYEPEERSTSDGRQLH